MMKRTMIGIVAVSTASFAVAQDRNTGTRHDEEKVQGGQVIIKTDEDTSSKAKEKETDQRRARVTTERDSTGARGGTEIRTTETRQTEIQTGGAIQAGDRTQAVQGQMSNEDVVRHLTSSNNFDIQLSQLAQEKSQDAQVKQFAQQMVQDHGQALQQVQQFARQNNIKVDNNELMPAQKAKLDEFRKKDGAQFDTMYSICQAGHHTESVLMHQHLANEHQNPQIQQMARQMLPKLQQHHQHAMTLAHAQVGASSAVQAGSRIEGSMDTSGSTDLNRSQSTGSSTTIQRESSIGTSTPGASGSVGTSGTGASGSIKADTDKSRSDQPRTPEPSPQDQSRQGSQTGAGTRSDNDNNR